MLFLALHFPSPEEFYIRFGDSVCFLLPTSVVCTTPYSWNFPGTLLSSLCYGSEWCGSGAASGMPWLLDWQRKLLRSLWGGRLCMLRWQASSPSWLIHPWGLIYLCIWSVSGNLDTASFSFPLKKVLSLNHVCLGSSSLLRIAVTNAVSHVAGLLFLHKQAELQLHGVDPGRNWSTFWILSCHQSYNLLGCSF